MKNKIDTLDASPPKSIYRSIIVDYDIKLGICELVDNAIDIWTKSGNQSQLSISIELDSKQQKIIVSDNAGGIREKEILLFISPGRTGNTATDETIGIFGVGSKRAVIALAQEIKMISRYNNAKTIQVELNDDWLKEDNWNIDVFHVTNVEPKTTRIELLALRSMLDDDVISRVINHLSSTYALFLRKENLEITVNGISISGIEYDKDWAYPPGYEPILSKFDMPIEQAVVNVEIYAGVIGEKASRGGESGVYFYCNERLIAKSLKDYEVGYIKGQAGQANHPGAALGRVIVKMRGQAQYMPWNSSKSAINYQNLVFQAVRKNVSTALTYFIGLSRRTQGDWPQHIYKFKKGVIREQTLPAADKISNLYGIPLPRTRRRYEEKLVDKNRKLGNKKPWVVGLYESIAAVEFLSSRSLKRRNRIILILLDSNLEIALKEYLVHEKGIGRNKFNIIKANRADIVREVQKYVPSITKNEWQRINYFYLMRNNLIHERLTAAVDDTDIKEYRKLVQKVLNILFEIKF